MKKKAVLLGLAALTVASLAGCGSSEPDPLDDDPIQLQKDPAKDYEFADSSNAEGSANYEIFVRSFYDSNGDGVGDLGGIKEKLPYLADMGYKSLWLMPIFPSGSYHGYDVLDYFSVNSDYGTLDDFDSLVSEAKKYNIEIVLDMVLNHCSRSNPYFTQALADYKAGRTGADSKADWFNFGEGGDHVYEGVYYESRFDANMPDFNLDCEAVRDEMESIIKFWIGHGVKGFRLDAVLYYYYQNTSKNTEFLNWLSDTAHKYDPDFHMVGECWVSDTALDPYFSSECDSFFDFSIASGGDNCCINFIKGYGRASNLSEFIQNHEERRKSLNADAYSTYFLSNHDQDRISKNFTDTNLYKSACTFYTLLPGDVYTYYGEEIALKGTRKTYPDDQNDVRRRLPMVWSGRNKAGECAFPDKSHPELDDNEQVSKGVEDQQNEAFSLLKHYKMMIHLRNKYSWIKHAKYKDVTSLLGISDFSVMAYSLTYGDNRIVVVHNFSSYNIEATSPGTEILEQINIMHRIPELSEGKLRLAAHSSVILK